MLAGEGGAGGDEVGGGALEDDLAAVMAGAGAEVDDPVGVRHDRLVVLVDSGKSVIVIEHHPAVMAHADWIVDLGPGAGHDGGRVVFEGTPSDLVAARSTLTGTHLAAYVGT